MKAKALVLGCGAVAVAAALFSHGAAAQSAVTGNVALVSDYVYRGFSQTNEKVALQAGVDWTGADGWYVGLWGSNVSWLSDAAPGSSNSVELDLYGGKRWSMGDLAFDVGLLQYYYPGSYSAAWKAASGLKTPHTTEVYGAMGYGPATFKISYALTDLFGAPNSDGSQYYDLTVAPEVMPGVKLLAHVGRQVVRGTGNADYTDWKVGVSASYGGFDWGLYYVDTNVSGSKLADSRVVFSVVKTF